MDDSEYLRQFIDAKSHEAFASLVGKHVHLVYSACLRQIEDAGRADLATQAAFVLLARHAGRAKGASVVPFLYDAARRVCSNMGRESAGAGSSSAAPTGMPAAVYSLPNDWGNLAPRVDDAMAALPEKLRHAVLLKYVAGLPLRDVAGAQGVADVTAGQRISAGATRLRRYFEGKSLFLAADSLVAAIQAHAVKPAPASVAYNATLAALMPAPVTPPPGENGSPAPPPSPSPAVGLADAVDRAARRSNVTSIAAMAVVVALLSVGVFKLGMFVRDARLAAATRPTATQGGGGGANPAGGNAAGSQPAVRPAIPEQPTPAVKPEKVLDPAMVEQFIAAVRQSDAAAVERMVDAEEAMVNAKDAKTGRTAIQIAADLVEWRRSETTRVAHFLIENGALTPIHVAARAGHRRLVAQYIRVRPQWLDLKDDAGLTPVQRAALIPASSPECEAVVDFLIEQEATIDIWTASTFGLLESVQKALAEHPELVNKPCLASTPLNWAVRPRRYTADPLAIPKLLIEKGADVNSRDAAADGMTPLHHAAEWGGQAAVVELLVSKGADVNAGDDFGWTPLDYAADRGHRDMIAALEARGAKRSTVDYADQPSKTARFYAAVRAGDAELTKQLLDDTPELATARGPTGETPMHHAAAIGATAIIDLLLADKADVNAAETNKYGGTPLHWAVRQGRAEAAKHLLAKGADAKAINARNGQTLLHVLARHHDDGALAEFLLAKGVDTTVKDRFGRTARDYAEQGGRMAVAARLMTVK